MARRFWCGSDRGWRRPSLPRRANSGSKSGAPSSPRQRHGRRPRTKHRSEQPSPPRSVRWRWTMARGVPFLRSGEDTASPQLALNFSAVGTAIVPQFALNFSTVGSAIVPQFALNFSTVGFAIAPQLALRIFRMSFSSQPIIVDVSGGAGSGASEEGRGLQAWEGSCAQPQITTEGNG